MKTFYIKITKIVLLVLLIFFIGYIINDNLNKYYENMTDEEQEKIEKITNIINKYSSSKLASMKATIRRNSSNSLAFTKELLDELFDEEDIEDILPLKPETYEMSVLNDIITSVEQERQESPITISGTLNDYTIFDFDVVDNIIKRKLN
jgi:hypothetical protein